MQFEYNEYQRALVNNPLLFFVMGAVILIFGIIVYKYPSLMWKFRLWQEPYESDRPIYLFYTVLCFVFGTAMSLNFMNVDLLLEDENNISVLHGNILEIEDTKQTFKLSYQGKRVNPNYIVIDDEEYFIMYIGDFDVGDTVEITYLPKSKVVLEIQYYQE